MAKEKKLKKVRWKKVKGLSMATSPSKRKPRLARIRKTRKPRKLRGKGFRTARGISRGMAEVSRGFQEDLKYVKAKYFSKKKSIYD